MNLRERLADWISGGELSKLQIALGIWRTGCKVEQKRVEEIAADRDRWRNESNQGWATAISRLCALQEIADCETPNANATVRRMARIAREALK